MPTPRDLSKQQNPSGFEDAERGYCGVCGLPGPLCECRGLRKGAPVAPPTTDTPDADTTFSPE